MNTYTTILGVVALLLALALGLVGFDALGDNDDCYTDAIELADEAVTTTDDFAAYTVDSLDRIMSGMPHNQSEMDRVASAHRSNTDTLADIQSRCEGT